MLRFLVVITAFGFLTLSAAPAIASTFFIERTAGMSGEIAHTTQELVRASLGELGQEVTLDPVKAEFTARPVLLGLGSSIIVTLEKRRKDVLIFSAKLKAISVEEMDTIVDRLARAIVHEKIPKDDVRVSEISEDEATRGNRRRPAKKAFLFGLGPTLVSNMNESGIGYYFTLGYSWDVGPAYLRLSAETFGKGGAFGLIGGIGASYFLSDRDFSPFIGADLSFGLAKVDPEGIGSTFDADLRTVGFAFGPIVGVQFFRTSAVNLELSLRAAFFLSSAKLGNPAFTVLRVGLYF